MKPLVTSYQLLQISGNCINEPYHEVLHGREIERMKTSVGDEQSRKSTRFPIWMINYQTLFIW